MQRKKVPQGQMPEDEDFQMRSHIEDTSICLTPTSRNEVRIMQSLPQEAHYETPNVSLNYFGVKELFSSRNGCYSSSRIEQNRSLNAITQTPGINLSYTPLTVHISPLKQTDSSRNSAVCVQDLNNLQGKNVEQRVVSCSRTIDRVRLKHLRQFNDIILNTSQWESLESSCAVDNDSEHSFFTPQLFQCNSASTPVVNTVGIQISSAKPMPSHRRSYKTSQSVVVPPMERISVERSRELCTIEMYMHNSSKLEKFIKKYPLFIKVIELCTWLGTTLKEGLISVYNLYTKQYFSHSVCNNCITYHNKIAELTSSVEKLHSEMQRMRDESKENCESVKQAICETIKQQLQSLEQNIRKDLVGAGTATPMHRIPPPPPPPPPVLVPLTVPTAVCKTKLVEKRKPTELSKPMISLDDILKVKLRKVSDRPSTKLRRATEPDLVSSIKALKPSSRQSGLMSTSVTPHLRSDSPSSCLVHMLSGVDTSIHKVKRLQRRSNSWLQSKRERE